MVLEIIGIILLCIVMFIIVSFLIIVLIVMFPFILPIIILITIVMYIFLFVFFIFCIIMIILYGNHIFYLITVCLGIILIPLVIISVFIIGTLIPLSIMDSMKKEQNILKDEDEDEEESEDQGNNVVTRFLIFGI